MDFSGCEIVISFADGFASQWKTADGDGLSADAKMSVVLRFEGLLREHYKGAVARVIYNDLSDANDPLNIETQCSDETAYLRLRTHVFYDLLEQAIQEISP